MVDDALLSLARYAEALAYTREYPAEDHPGILAKLGTSPDAFAASQARWASEIGAELAAGDPTLALELADRYAHVLAGIRLRHPRVAKIAPDPSLEAIVTPNRVVVPERRPPPPVDIGTPPKEVPTYLKPPPKHKLMQPAPLAPLEETAMIPDVKEVMRRALEADPRVAIPRGAAAMTLNVKEEAHEVGTLESGATVTINEVPGLPDPTPFNRPRIKPEDLDLSLFPLEVYAAISGALARGEPRSAVFAKHRLTDEFYDALGVAWGLRFQKEPELGARYREMARREAHTTEKS